MTLPPAAAPPLDRSALLRASRRIARALIPPRWQLPARYQYRRLLGALDPECRLLPELVRRGATAVDVGANLGVYTYALWRLGARVEAFEPLPDFAAAIRAFGAPTIRVHQVALSSAPGVRPFYFARDGGVVDRGRGSLSPAAPGSDRVDVPTRTLDEYRFPDVTFIKIDAEGHELEVLRGAAETIRRYRPALLIEIEQRHLPFPMQVVFDHLAGLGYHGEFLEGGRRRPLSEFSHERHQQAWLSDVYAPQYINNFLFVA
jgi:FkbM family methyltransferase